ncbi:shugoshin 1-like [Rhinoraja longicauda]
MAFENCQKMSFQENLEAIKERMKEKRNQNQAKFNRSKQCSKVSSKVLNKSSFTKSIQANNQSLALSLQAEKKKLRVASDIILALKKERQAMMFYILMLKKQLGGQVENLRLIPDPVGENLSILEQDLVHSLPYCSFPIEPVIQDVAKDIPLENSRADCNTPAENLTVLPSLEDIQPTSVNISSGRRSTCHLSPDSDSNAVTSFDVYIEGLGLPKGVSRRRRTGRKTSRCLEHLDTFHISENDSEMSWANEEEKFARLRPRTSSRDQSQNTRCITKERQNSLDCSDTYNFDNEECIHLTPFRRKDESIAVGNVDNTCSEDESDDSLYIPPADKRRRKSNYNQAKNEGTTALTTSSRSSRTLQKRVHKDSEVIKEEQINGIPNEYEGCKKTEKDVQLHIESGSTPRNISVKPQVKGFGSRFSLSDVTNCSSLPAENMKNMVEKTNTISPKAAHKRRCTILINYKEPSLHLKLRRGDKYTDTQFLNSPIFKLKKTDGSRRKSEKKQSLSCYDEVFVGS